MIPRADFAPFAAIISTLEWDSRRRSVRIISGRSDYTRHHESAERLLNSMPDPNPAVADPGCARFKKEPRILGLSVRDQHEALQTAREVQVTEACRRQYAARAALKAPRASHPARWPAPVSRPRTGQNPPTTRGYCHRDEPDPGR